MSGLWKNDPATRGGKYLVMRRDGTIPAWPNFVLGARDPDAPGALRDYAARCERRGRDPQYVADLRALAEEFERYLAAHGEGDPDAPRHRSDDPAVIAMMNGKRE